MEPVAETSSENNTSTVSLLLKVPITTKEVPDFMGFAEVDVEGFIWQIYCSVKGDSLQPQIQCYHPFESKLWVYKTICEVGLLNKENDVVHYLSKVHNFNCGNETLYFEFLQPWSTLRKDSSLVTADNVTIKATIRIISDARFKNVVSLGFSVHSNHSDVVLLVKDKRFHLNKATLALQSPFFESLFYSSFAEKDKEEITLTDVDPEEFESFLFFIYPLSYRITEENCEFMLKMADKFQVDRLLQACEDFLCMEDRCSEMETVKLADKYRLPKVITACIDDLQDAAFLKKFTQQLGFNELSATTRYEVLLKLTSF